MADKKKIIIWGFPGVGKSLVANGKRIFDVDSAYFRFHMFDTIFSPEIQLEYQDILEKPYPENLIYFIKDVNADVVLTNCHVSLLHRFENVYLIYPTVELKEAFLRCYKNRGNDKSYIEYMSDTYEEILAALAALTYPRYIITEEDTYLKDIIFDDKGELDLSRFRNETVRTISREGR